MTSPKHILTTLHLIRAGLATSLLAKTDVVQWADKIITTDEQPDIFFIDLSLSGSKSTKAIISYFDDYLDFEKPAIPGRPLVGLVYRNYKTGQIDLADAIRKLCQLNCEAIFTDKEESYIYIIEDEFDGAKNGIYGTLEEVRDETERFLALYQNYRFDNLEQWKELDKLVEIELAAAFKLKEEQRQIYNMSTVLKNKPWWKLW